MSEFGYRVARGEGGCRMVFGPIPITDMVALLGAWGGFGQHGCEDDVPDDQRPDGERWHLDAKLAKALGANFVAGPKEELDAWRAKLDLA